MLVVLTETYRKYSENTMGWFHSNSILWFFFGMWLHVDWRIKSTSVLEEASKILVPSTKVHGVTSHKTVTLIASVIGLLLRILPWKRYFEIWCAFNFCLSTRHGHVIFTIGSKAYLAMIPVNSPLIIICICYYSFRGLLWKQNATWDSFIDCTGKVWCSNAKWSVGVCWLLCDTCNVV